MKCTILHSKIHIELIIKIYSILYSFYRIKLTLRFESIFFFFLFVLLTNTHKLYKAQEYKVCVFCYTYFTSNVHLRFTEKAYEKKNRNQFPVVSSNFYKNYLFNLRHKIRRICFLFWCRVEEFNKTFSSLLNVIYIAPPESQTA